MKLVSSEDFTAHKKTMITVPSYISTAKEAVAWSFNTTPEEYQCNIET